jgi:hypothetical protein
MRIRITITAIIAILVILGGYTTAPSPAPSPIPPPTPTPRSVLEELSTKIHEDTWLRLLSEAATDQYLKYGLYGYRTLAVKHPEIYLQADDILAQVLTGNAGSKEAYLIKNVHSDYFYSWKRGASFSFSDVDFSSYNLVNCQELYPSHYPFLPFLDRRLDFITTTLKTYDNRITQLEKIEQRYFAEKERGSKVLYIVHCDNGNTYLYRDGSLISAVEQKAVEQTDGNPVLIFNEENVWYPLMERDDTSKCNVLSKIVSRYSTQVKEPTLSNFEKGVICQLKMVTEFPDARDLFFLKFVCINASEGMANLLPRRMMQEYENAKLPYFVWCERALNEKMNLFSPISAFLAATAKGGEGRNGIVAMCNEYAKYTRTPKHRFSHGHIWLCSMLEYGIEHAYRTHAGHYVVQAAAIGAALELAGVDRYRLQGFAFSGDKIFAHDYVYIPEHDMIISNARIGTLTGRVGGTVIDSSNVGEIKYIDFIEHEGKWAYLWRAPICSPYYGTLSPRETIEILEHLISIHNDNIQARTFKRKKFVEIPIGQIKRQLAKEQKRWEPYKLPPYGIP